jgi:hypothetical protein
LKHLHIICFTVPYPPDYGGVIDLFWKLPALQAAGVNIHLHCFDYGRGKQDELNKYCATVNYYQRKTGLQSISFKVPYIVSSRSSKMLIQHLLKDDYPILMEGVHSSFILNDERFNDRKKIVRLHNVEHHYYHHLYQSSSSFFKKIYYFIESFLLKKYEQTIIRKANELWAVTIKDKDFFYQQYQFKQTKYLPIFLPDNWQFNVQEGKGNYILYQADLSVDINERTAIWLLENICKQLPFNFFIAGKNPTTFLQQQIAKYTNVTLIANPTNDSMQQLIKEAHINILPSFSNTGIKLKLLNALFNGRFCLVNKASIEGTGLDELCEIANDVPTMQNTITQLMQQSFVLDDIEQRKKILLAIYHNNNNAKQVVQWIWDNN